MNTKEKLNFLLKRYVKEYRELNEKYKNQRTALTLYEEIFQIVNDGLINENKLVISLLLNTIYKNNIYVDEFYRVLLNKDNKLISIFFNKLKNDYNDLKIENDLLDLRIKRNKEMFFSCKRVIACLKYNTVIFKNKNDIFNIKRVISYYEAAGVISGKEELLFINEIENHNRNVEVKKSYHEQERVYADILYNEIPNILNMGFQEHDVIEVSEDRKSSLDKFVSEILNISDYIDTDELIGILEDYKSFNLENSEYNYIIVSLLEHFSENLIVLYELLIDKDVYRYRSQRADVIKDYYQLLDRYVEVKKYYDKLSEFEIENESDEVVTLEDKKEKRLIYSHSFVNVKNAKFISDMDDIPYEYYDTVDYLINGFVNGTLQPSEVKVLKNQKSIKGYIELRYDQVRIFLKHIRDDIYNVYGVFVKKEFNDMSMYRNVGNRMTPDVSRDDLLETELELSKIVEEEFKALINEKSRKGIR